MASFEISSPSTFTLLLRRYPLSSSMKKSSSLWLAAMESIIPKNAIDIASMNTKNIYLVGDKVIATMIPAYRINP